MTFNIDEKDLQDMMDKFKKDTDHRNLTAFTNAYTLFKLIISDPDAQHALSKIENPGFIEYFVYRMPYYLSKKVTSKRARERFHLDDAKGSEKNVCIE